MQDLLEAAREELTERLQETDLDLPEALTELGYPQELIEDAADLPELIRCPLCRHWLHIDEYDPDEKLCYLCPC